MKNKITKPKKRVVKASSIYENYFTIEVVGNWVALATCKICGAAVILNDGEGAEIHKKYHV